MKIANSFEKLDLLYKLIENGADWKTVCIEEGPDEGKTILWFEAELAATFNQWEPVNKLIESGANINDMCTGKGPDNGKSILWFAAKSKNWELVSKLIGLGANINSAYCRSRQISALGMAQAYNNTNVNNPNAINKDIFYLMLIVRHLQSNYFQCPGDVSLTDEVKQIIENLKHKIDIYKRIFIPTTENLAEANSYKENNLNNLPAEIRKLIAIEHINKDLATYSLSPRCIEYFSNVLANHIFNHLTKEDVASIQTAFEEGPHFYELVLFSNILQSLRENSKMKDLDKSIFRKNFLPAFNDSKNKELASLNFTERQQLYAIAKQYSKEKKPEENPLTKDDFLNIFNQTSAFLRNK